MGFSLAAVAMAAALGALLPTVARVIARGVGRAARLRGPLARAWARLAAKVPARVRWPAKLRWPARLRWPAKLRWPKWLRREAAPATAMVADEAAAATSDARDVDGASRFVGGVALALLLALLVPLVTATLAFRRLATTGEGAPAFVPLGAIALVLLAAAARALPRRPPAA